MNGDGLLKYSHKRILVILFIALIFALYLLDTRIIKADEISNLKDEKSGLESTLNDFNSKMNEINNKVAQIENEISMVEQEISTNSEILEQTKIAKQEQYEAMRTRIKFLYEMGETTYIDIFFSSENISSIINKSEFVSSLIEYDRNMLSEYQKTQEDIEEAEKSLVEKKEELVSLKEEASKEQASIQTLIKEIQRNILEYSDQIDILEEQARLEAEELQKQKEESSEEELPTTGQVVNDYVVQAGDLELLAAIIYCEARGESYYGQLAVGAVVLNRVNDTRFPDTIRGVIYQPSQFSPVWAGSPTYFDIALARGANETCIAAAREVLSGNIVGEWLYFRTAVSGHSGTIIGNHVFY